MRVADGRDDKNNADKKDDKRHSPKPNVAAEPRKFPIVETTLPRLIPDATLLVAVLIIVVAACEAGEAGETVAVPELDEGFPHSTAV